VARALAADPDLEAVLVGPPAVAADVLAAAPQFSARVTVLPAAERVRMDEQPARAVRAKRDATVVVAMRALREGSVDAVVSVGSTGATMAAAVTLLGRLPGISRPALAAVLPAPRSPVVLLDVGANTGATAELLVQFALAGAAFARVRLGLPAPRVGLLNVGSESGKGDAVRRAAGARLEQALRDAQATFVGNVEADAVALGGSADVVVTDGFTGNVLIKGIEATADALAHALAAAGDDEACVRLASFRPEAQGGTVLLGVDGVVVVGHGASDAPAVAACIAAATRMSVISKTAAGVAVRGGEG
jgi:phosphate acyltransferase